VQVKLSRHEISEVYKLLHLYSRSDTFRSVPYNLDYNPNSDSDFDYSTCTLVDMGVAHHMATQHQWNFTAQDIRHT